MKIATRDGIGASIPGPTRRVKRAKRPERNLSRPPERTRLVARLPSRPLNLLGRLRALGQIHAQPLFAGVPARPILWRLAHRIEHVSDAHGDGVWFPFDPGHAGGILGDDAIGERGDRPVEVTLDLQQ